MTKWRANWIRIRHQAETSSQEEKGEEEEEKEGDEDQSEEHQDLKDARKKAADKTKAELKRRVSNESDGQASELALRVGQMTTTKTPIRQDGTKTPLRETKKSTRTRAREASSDSEEEKKEDESQATGSEGHTSATIRSEFLRDRLDRKTCENDHKKELKTLAATVNSLEYDVDSQGRSQRYTLYKMLNDDQQRAAKVLHLEFPKEASLNDRREFCNWLLEDAQVQDIVDMSFVNHQGEVARAGRLTFTSSFHRAKVFSHWAETWSRQKPLYFWSSGTGSTWHSIVLRKELSEDARIRGRYLKAAMDSINYLPHVDDCKKGATPCTHEDHRPDFYPKWQDNSIREPESHEFLVWCHFSYTKATVAIFIDESCYGTVVDHFEGCLAKIMNGQGGKDKDGKCKGDGKGNKGDGQSIASSSHLACLPLFFTIVLPIKSFIPIIIF